jgi:hypothetical protein
MHSKRIIRGVKMKKIIYLIILTGNVSFILSQDSRNFYLKGKTELCTSVSFVNNGDYSLQFQLTYFLFENFSFGSRVIFSSIENIDISVIAETSIPILSNKIIPYIIIGYGYNFQVQDVKIHSTFNLLNYRLKKILSIGGGFKIPISPQFSLRIELCYTDRPENKYESSNSNILSLVNPKKSRDIIDQDYNYSIGLSLFL